MKFLLNIIWFVFGGIFIVMEYFFASLLLMVTIIGIPFGLQTLKMSKIALAPFSFEVVDGQDSDGCVSLFMNIIWILIGGIWISLSHLFLGLLFCITIIGIPFGMQHFKLAKIALVPFGKMVV